ncbi:hypothetical protein ACJX0J_035278, partial [Zea mays]
KLSRVFTLLQGGSKWIEIYIHPFFLKHMEEYHVMEIFYADQLNYIFARLIYDVDIEVALSSILDATTEWNNPYPHLEYHVMLLAGL